MAIASVIYSVIKAVPAVRDIFRDVQDLYYNNLFEGLSTQTNIKKGKRRALSNSIENASTDEDRRYLSIMLHEHANGVQSSGHRGSSGSSTDSE